MQSFVFATKKAAALQLLIFSGMKAGFRAYPVREVIFMTKHSSVPTWRSLLLLIVVTLGSGGLVGFLTQRDTEFYESLIKPVFAPPGWLFPVAWSILYVAMAVSAWFMLSAGGRDRFLLLGLYFAQLAVNLIWPVIFFIGKALGMAFFWLVLLWALAAVMLCQFFRESRVAGWLLVPYQLWLTFAGVLNFFIASLNQ